MHAVLAQLLGPRVPAEEFAARATRYRLPKLTLAVARIALLVSIFVPYWSMELEAPQYPDGLHVQAYVNRLVGDVKEIDGLNHYIGMRPLEEAARLERTLAVASLIVLVLVMECAAIVHTKWIVLLLLPVIAFPAFFLIDLHFWLDHFGQNLDPAAPLSNAIDPFTPPVLGTGMVGQFKTVARPGPGLILAVFASVLAIVTLFLHRRAYKPLVDARQANA